jgi:signal transduction histidine kinase
MTNAVYYLEMIQEGADPEVREYLGIVRGQIGIADRIVTDLLDFARIKPPQRKEVPLAGLVDEQLARLGPINGVEVRREFAPDLPPAWIDAGQVGQIVLNLLANAVQAMEERGVLTLRGCATPEGVRLDVRDTGGGIPPELQQKIFEPLFTTKARGIGLGLAVSRSLAQANGGGLAVSSAPGEGATFTLTLPAAQGAAV